MGRGLASKVMLSAQDYEQLKNPEFYTQVPDTHNTFKTLQNTFKSRRSHKSLMNLARFIFMSMLTCATLYIGFVASKICVNDNSGCFQMRFSI